MSNPLYDLLEEAAGSAPTSPSRQPKPAKPMRSQSSSSVPDWLIPFALQLLGFVAWWLLSGFAHRQGFAGALPLIAYLAISAGISFAPEIVYRFAPPPVLIGFAFGEQLLSILMRLGTRR